MEVDVSKYRSIKEAAVAYQVSRTKIHRLVKSGVVRATKDPRDERVTLVNLDDLDTRFLGENAMEMMSMANVVGIATMEKLNTMTAIRERSAVYGIRSDSTEILRQERDTRSRELDIRSMDEADVVNEAAS